MFYERLKPYQKVAVDRLMSQKKYALFFDQGTGKTWCTVGMIEKLLSETFSCLIVAPLTSLGDTWLSLIKEVFPSLMVTSDLEIFKSFEGPKILLLHYEAFVKLAKWITGKKWTFVVFDESQKLMGVGTKQSRAAGRIQDAEYKLILSGTPIEQTPLDLWGQFRFLDPSILGPRKAFERKWSYRTGYMGYKKVFKKYLMKEFLALVSPYCYRVERDEVLDLPSLELVPVYLHLMGEQAEIYDQVERNLVNELASELKITKLLKLRQITGGFVKDKEGDTYHVGDSKLKKLRFLVSKLDGALVIFCAFSAEIGAVYNLMKAMGRKPALIEGSTNRSERPEIIRDFRNGVYDTLVLQTKIGSVSLNLQSAQNLIVYSMSYSFIDHSQLIARVHRMGQKQSVKIFSCWRKILLTWLSTRR